MGEDLNNWMSIIRSCIITSKDPLTPYEINRDTKMLEGKDIPYRQFMFNSLEEMLRKIPGVKVFQECGQTLVQVIPTSETAHIAKMVSLQKPNKKKNKYQRNWKHGYNQLTKKINQGKGNFNAFKPYNVPKNSNFNLPKHTEQKENVNPQMKKKQPTLPQVPRSSLPWKAEPVTAPKSAFERLFPPVPQRLYGNWSQNTFNHQQRDAFVPERYHVDDRKQDMWKFREPIAQMQDTWQAPEHIYQKQDCWQTHAPIAQKFSRVQRYEPYKPRGTQQWQTFAPPVRDFFRSAEKRINNNWGYNSSDECSRWNTQNNYRSQNYNNEYFKRDNFRYEGYDVQSSDYYTIKPPKKYNRRPFYY